MALKKIDYVNAGKADSLAGTKLASVKISQKWQQDAYDAGWQEGEDEKATAKAEEYQKAVTWTPPRKTVNITRQQRRVLDVEKRTQATLKVLAGRAKHRAMMPEQWQ